MKRITTFLLLLSFSIAHSQRAYDHEFSFSNDNDLYISTSQDRYYTNGMTFGYRYLADSTQISAKKIYQFRLGHKMYTPFKATVSSPELHDRPFASYLYLSGGIAHYFKQGETLAVDAELGIIGPAAMGRELQDFIHDIYGFRKATGWQYQIKNAFAINIKAQYTRPLWTSINNKLDIHWLNSGSLGTVFTDISTGVLSRWGFYTLQSSTNSLAFGSNLNGNAEISQNKSEFFLIFKPSVQYVFHDATIEGSIFRTDNPITFPINPLVFNAELGIMFTSNRFNFGYSIFYHTKKLQSVRVPESNFYGNITLRYLWN